MHCVVLFISQSTMGTKYSRVKSIVIKKLMKQTFFVSFIFSLFILRFMYVKSAYKLGSYNRTGMATTASLDEYRIH